MHETHGQLICSACGVALTAILRDEREAPVSNTGPAEPRSAPRLRVDTSGGRSPVSVAPVAPDGAAGVIAAWFAAGASFGDRAAFDAAQTAAKGLGYRYAPQGRNGPTVRIVDWLKAQPVDVTWAVLLAAGVVE